MTKMMIAILIAPMIVGSFTPTPAPEVIETPPAIVEVTPAEPQEDGPEFDCRVHGNHICGVEVKGTWYLLDFDTMTLTPRP